MHGKSLGKGRNLKMSFLFIDIETDDSGGCELDFYRSHGVTFQAMTSSQHLQQVYNLS